MSDTGPPTTVDYIFVVGQRRRPGQNFPPAAGSGGGGTGGGDGVNQNELDPNEPPPPPSPPHACDNPETALDWNADAAAAEALQRMIDKATAQNDATHNLANREYGAMICESSTGGLFISDVVWGDPIFDEQGNWVGAGTQPSVEVNIYACGAGNRPLAMIHSHLGVGAQGGLPSPSDATWVSAINGLRGDNAGRIYLVSTGDVNNPFEIRVYDERNVDRGSVNGDEGPEVNPNGLPCPGVVIT